MTIKLTSQMGLNLDNEDDCIRVCRHFPELVPPETELGRHEQWRWPVRPNGNSLSLTILELQVSE